MIRTLTLMRHGKSSWAEPGLSDFERPLNARGRTSVPIIGQWLAKNNAIPDLIVASTALRTKQTTEVLVASLGVDLPVHYEPRLYLASPATILSRVSQVDDRYQRVMIVAHNPGLEELASAMSQTYRDFPTAALAAFECELDHWSEIMSRAETLRWELKHWMTPKELSPQDDVS